MFMGLKAWSARGASLKRLLEKLTRRGRGEILECVGGEVRVRGSVKADLHGTTLSHTTSLRQAYDKNCFL